ncbi:Sua5 family C-terminal domain-containing protein, partial [Treponema sp. R6D11]
NIIIISRNKYDGVINLYSGKDDKEFAHNLFSLFRKCDDLGAEKIYIDPPETETGIAKGIHTRINKAISSYSEVIISKHNGEDISTFIKDKIMGEVLIAKLGRDVVGVLEYLENEFEIEILNIVVANKRQKIGTQLINI